MQAVGAEPEREFQVIVDDQVARARIAAQGQQRRRLLPPQLRGRGLVAVLDQRGAARESLANFAHESRGIALIGRDGVQAANRVRADG